MVMIVKSWKCGICEEVFDTKEDAKKCEADCKEYKEIQSLVKKRQKLFPSHYEKDTRYEKHCVDCGISLLEWEREFDGHRAEMGRLIFEGEYVETFGGKRCSKCDAKFQTKVKKLSESKDPEIAKILILIAQKKI